MVVAARLLDVLRDEALVAHPAARRYVCRIEVDGRDIPVGVLATLRLSPRDQRAVVDLATADPEEPELAACTELRDLVALARAGGNGEVIVVGRAKRVGVAVGVIGAEAPVGATAIGRAGEVLALRVEQTNDRLSPAADTIVEVAGDARHRPRRLVSCLRPDQLRDREDVVARPD